MRIRFVGEVFAGILALAVSAGASAAQTVHGQFVDSATDRPVSGALVVLIDGSGGEVVEDLTDSSGNFSVRAPRPGRYRLRAQRVGFESAVTEAFDLTSGDAVERDIVAVMTPVAIGGITVAATSPCDVRPAEGRATFQLWDEIRKALDAASFTQRKSLYQFRVRTYSRNLDPSSLRVLPDSGVERASTLILTRPFVSISAERLLRDGFVQQTAGGINYYAPDAEVLLSETFLDDYCFGLTESGASPGEIGLTFHPVSKHGPPALEGTLWVDRASRELRRLEYGYTRLSLPGPAANRAGGTIEFEALPAGAWIVRRWAIRMPTEVTINGRGAATSATMSCGPKCYSTRTGFLSMPNPETVLTGLREEGGEVVAVIPLRGSPLPATLEGMVYDSIKSMPIAGARVYLSGTQYAGITDATGHFRIDGVPAGSFSVAFTYPRLSRLHLFPPAKQVELNAGKSTQVRLTLRSDVEAGALASVCPNLRQTGPTAGVAALIGDLRDEATGAPLPDLEVSVGWQPGTAGPEDLARAVVNTRSAADGSYVACGVGANRPLTVKVKRAGELILETLAPEIEAFRVGIEDLDVGTAASTTAGDASFGVVTLEGISVTASPNEASIRRTTVDRQQLTHFQGSSVYAAIEATHSTWLIPRGTGAAGAGVQIYVDGVRLTGRLDERLTELKRMPLATIGSIKHLDFIEASTRFGLDHTDGAILISTR